MQLIRVEEDLKEQLDCDFIMVIDTEGLKAPELAQLVNSYEHDNELATMVVGLSDITIINIAMENAAEETPVTEVEQPIMADIFIFRVPSHDLFLNA